jgi:hypothetical protein
MLHVARLAGVLGVVAEQSPVSGYDGLVRAGASWGADTVTCTCSESGIHAIERTVGPQSDWLDTLSLQHPLLLILTVIGWVSADLQAVTEAMPARSAGGRAAYNGVLGVPTVGLAASCGRSSVIVTT